MGTAFMVGLSEAATAGHCVYNADKGGFAKQIDIWPGANGSTKNSPFGKAGAQTVVIPKLYVTSNNRNLDAALISLDSAIGVKTGYFGLRYQKADITKNIYVEGYPGDHIMELWRMKGYISENNQYTLTYTIDTAGGQSGSPVFRSFNGQWYAIGIHTAGIKNRNGVLYKNAATRMSLPIFVMMKEYISFSSGA
ncbi:MAG: trypsin-like serine peptidase [Oliverpabstia sp.]